MCTFCAVAIHKLQQVDAFVARDFEPEVPAIGIVRSAKKILQGGAKELARSSTYQCAVFNMKVGGASAGINADTDERAAAVEAFGAELSDEVASGLLMIDGGKGIADGALDHLADVDNRSTARRRVVDGLANTVHMTGLGAVVCAEAAHPLDGASVAIDHFEHAGPAIARAVADRGGRVTAVSTSAGTATSPDGFDIDALIAALASDGPGMVNQFAEEAEPVWKLLGAEADVLFGGSKMGLIDHKGAEFVQAKVMVPTAPIPYTTKGALTMERNGTRVLPGFVTTGGSIFADVPAGGDDQESIERTASDALTTLTSALLAGDDSPILEACHRAESFLATWRDSVPFGRPFAP